MSLIREELIYISKIAEQTDRFEDMLECMKKVTLIGQELSIEERNLFSIACKNCVGSHRTSWRALSTIEKNEEAKGPQNLKLLRDYKEKIESELTDSCNDILTLIENYLIKSSDSPENKVFFLKMKADYNRYISEYATGELHTKASENASNAYKCAFDIASQELKTTNPIRLGLALNYSVYFYEVLNDSKKAFSLVKQAFDEALADIDNISEEEYKDVMTIMQLVRDSVSFWPNEIQENEEMDETVEENL